ncbi:MAG: hypothetical protein IJP03_03970 [Christensenellaceae bacterium]|nr:hypothetical protein [Christensenellaceae bacterium]
MKNKAMQPDLPRITWWLNFLLFLVLPPVGLIYFIVRAVLEKKLHKMGEDTLFGPAFASIVWGLFAMGLVALCLGDSQPAVILLFLPPFVCGVGMLLLRRKYMRLDERYRLCRTIVFKGHLRDLEKIAECLSVAADEAADFLQQMAEKGYLPGCRVDRAAGMLQVAEAWAQKQHTCTHCGAEFAVDVGVDLICPYCGAAIE